MGGNRVCAALLAAGLSALPEIAAAQVSADARVVARELFTEGRALVEQGDYARACEKFAESQRLDPGGGTLLNLAVCHEKTGRTATAWVELSEARRVAELDDRPDRLDLAREHLEALAPALTRLRVVVAPDVARIPGLVVSRDGVPLGEAAWGEAVPVDPGTHTIETSAPRRAPWKIRLDVIGPGHTEIVAVHAPDALAEGSPREGARSSRERTLGVAAGGAGAAALGGALAFYVAAVSTEKASDRECPAPDLCTRRGVELNDRARGFADAATALAIGGVVAAGVGAALYLTAPRSASGISRRPASDARSWSVLLF